MSQGAIAEWGILIVGLLAMLYVLTYEEPEPPALRDYDRRKQNEERRAFLDALRTVREPKP